MLQGPSGGGKTRLACTGPAWIAPVIVDPNGKPTVDKMRSQGAKILVPKFDVLAPEHNPMRLHKILKEAQVEVDAGRDDPTKQVHRDHMNRILHAIGSVIQEDRVRTLLIDGAYQIANSATYMEHGRLEKIRQRNRGEQNRILSDILNAAIKSDKHVIITSEVTSKYVDSGRVDKSGEPIQNETPLYRRRGGWTGLSGSFRVEANMMVCESTDQVERANYNITDHFDGFEKAEKRFWKRVRPGDHPTCKSGDWVMIIFASKDNTDLLRGDRDLSVLMNEEITFKEVYSRVWGRELVD